MNIKNICRIIISNLFLIFISNNALSNENFICFPKDENIVNFNGVLKKTSSLNLYSHFIWNDNSRSLKFYYFDGDSYKLDNMRVLQKGTKINPMKALHEEINKNTGESFTSFLQIHTYRPDELPFIYLRGGRVLSGNCKEYENN